MSKGFVAFFAFFGCGGIAVVDDGAGGGQSGSSTRATKAVTKVSAASTKASTKASSNASTKAVAATGSNCPELQAKLEQALAEGSKCNPCDDFDLCTAAKAFGKDTCGCPVPLTSSAYAQTAISLFNAWVAAACGPFVCDERCQSVAGGSYCAPTNGNCVGQCHPLAVPD